MIQENSQLLKNFAHHPERRLRFETDPFGQPIQALDPVGQNDPGDGAGGRKGDLEGIALGSGGDGAEQGEAGFPIVVSRAQRQGWEASRLFMSGFKIEKRKESDCQPSRMGLAGGAELYPARDITEGRNSGPGHHAQGLAVVFRELPVD